MYIYGNILILGSGLLKLEEKLWVIDTVLK